MYFTSVPEDLLDGFQTSKQVLSHLVFWHREYVINLSALLEGRSLELRRGKFRELNDLAYAEFHDRSMHELAGLFSNYQARLENLLVGEFDPQLRMPVKLGGHAWGILELIESVEAHIRRHLLRLKAAQRVKRQ